MVLDADACKPGLNPPNTATMRPGPGAPWYRLIKNTWCQGGIAYEYEHLTYETPNYEKCASACQNVQPYCVGVNFIQEDDVYFKCQIMSAISSLEPNDKSLCYKLE